MLMSFVNFHQIAKYSFGTFFINYSQIYFIKQISHPCRTGKKTEIFLFRVSIFLPQVIKFFTIMFFSSTGLVCSVAEVAVSDYVKPTSWCRRRRACI